MTCDIRKRLRLRLGIVASRKERTFYPLIERAKEGKSHRPSEVLTVITVIIDQKKESYR